MPEGDTIYRTATRLQKALTGQTLRSITVERHPGPVPHPGVTVTDVAAQGKYLHIYFDDGAVLETHMKMTGSWHLYRRNQRWRKSRRAARAILVTANGWEAVCFSAPHVRLLRRDRLSTGHLGPDLCSPAPDIDLAVRRFSLLASTCLVADALLDQRVCNGVGNVYKSEVLHQHRLHPATAIDRIDATTRRSLVMTSHQLLRRNLDGSQRITTTGHGQPALAVYGRAGQPCLVCNTLIERAELGRHHRATFWCPICQPIA